MLFPRAARAAEDVDLLLVLAADVSRSIDAAKFQLQREGYAAAVSDPRVLEAIRSGRTGRIGLTLRRMVGCRRAEGRDRLDDDRRRGIGERLWRPAAGGAALVRRSHLDQRRDRVRHGAARHAPYESARRTIDISGDGTNNAGRDVTLLRDEAVAKGITINGLVILSENPMSWNPDHTNPPGGLANYYRNNVIGGPGAFVMVGGELQLVRSGHHQEDDCRGGAGARADAAAGSGPLRSGPSAAGAAIILLLLPAFRGSSAWPPATKATQMSGSLQSAPRSVISTGPATSELRPLTAATGLKRLAIAVAAMVAAAFRDPDCVVVPRFLPRQCAMRSPRKFTPSPGSTRFCAATFSVSLFPSGTVSFHDVLLGDDRTGEPAVVADELTARLRYFPLLAGRVEIADVTLVRPTITVTFLPGGQSNWSGLIASLARALAARSGSHSLIFRDRHR